MFRKPDLARWMNPRSQGTCGLGHLRFLDIPVKIGNCGSELALIHRMFKYRELPKGWSGFF
jgi:hypothetical protein